MDTPTYLDAAKEPALRLRYSVLLDGSPVAGPWLSADVRRGEVWVPVLLPNGQTMCACKVRRNRAGERVFFSPAGPYPVPTEAEVRAGRMALRRRGLVEIVPST